MSLDTPLIVGKQVHASIHVKNPRVKICQFLNSVCYVTHHHYKEKLRLYRGEIGGQCPVLANTWVRLPKEKVWQRKKMHNLQKNDWNFPIIEWLSPVSDSFTHSCGHAYEDHRYRLIYPDFLLINFLPQGNFNFILRNDW